MPYRNIPLVTNEIYHIFNRGVEKRNIFTSRREYRRFLETMIYYQQIKPAVKFSQAQMEQNQDTSQQKLVEIIAYCLMPNHFHILVEQTADNGISIFVRRLANSFTRYFNTKNDRIGPLLQGQFKTVRIETDEQLIHVSRYIHLNPVVGFMVKDPNQYEWSSHLEYLGIRKTAICQKEKVLDLFSNTEAYNKFVLDQIDYAKQLEEIKHLLIER